MKVYIVIESYFDGCEYWESILEIYLDEDTALIRCLDLNGDSSGSTSWFVRSHEVLKDLKYD